MAVMVRLSPQIWLPLSCSRATAAVSALAKRTMATRLSCSNSVAVKPQQQHDVLSCSRAMIAPQAMATCYCWSIRVGGTWQGFLHFFGPGV